MRLFQEGLDLVRGLTVKTPERCRAFIGMLLRDIDDDCVAVLRILEDARSANPADPPAWIAAAVLERRRWRRRAREPAEKSGGKLGYLARELGIREGGAK